MVFAARLTQRGHQIATMDDLMALYEKSFSENTVAAISGLPHPTVQKFAVITVAVVGASRRFLSQITRHQNEVKFMSASLQYSNYAGQADFAVDSFICGFRLAWEMANELNHYMEERPEPEDDPSPDALP